MKTIFAAAALAASLLALGGCAGMDRQTAGTVGGAVVYNSNYGQPTAYQAPLYMRLGARLSF